MPDASLRDAPEPDLDGWLLMFCRCPFDEAANAVLLWLGPNSQTPFGQTPQARELWETLRKEEGPAAAIEALAACGADPARADPTGTTPLMHAAACGAAECVKALAPRSDVAATNDFGWSAFALAATHGHAKCLEALLPFCDPEAADADGFTPLMQAAYNQQREAVAFLLPRCDPLRKTPHGVDAFDSAVGIEAWDCADLFASLVSVDRLRDAASLAPAADLPAIRAAIEREELLRSVSQASGLEAGGVASGAQPENEEPARRAPRL